MNRATRIYLMGSEQKGWALDADLATIRQSLALVPEVTEVASVHEADVVHSVWEYPLLTSDHRALEGKRVVCTFCNDVGRTFDQACMIHASEVVGIWIAISKRAEQEARGFRLPVTYIPYAIDPALFLAEVPGGETAASLRRRHGLPEDAYVISSFMRDSLGSDLFRPKPQKGVEMFVEIVGGLHRKGHPVHVLLAGPRRHWVRRELRARGVPFTFVGAETPGDDNTFNILDAATIRDLYRASDLHLVTSRWEGGPRAVLEAAAVGVRVASTPVGLAEDVLDPSCIFDDVAAGAALLERDVRTGALGATLEGNRERVRANHTPAANAARYAWLFAKAGELPPHRLRAPNGPTGLAAGVPAGVSLLERLRSRWIAARRTRLPGAGMRVGLWHEFHKPPYGGGNQFMMALKRALENLGASVRTNSASPAIDVHLCNSAWFDAALLDRARRGGKIRMLHRIDGPVGVYRGGDMAEDDRILALNGKFASATVMQSAWCLRKTLELGYEPRRPVIVHNAVDGRIFNPAGAARRARDGKLRLVATSWSDNPRKGGPFYMQLEQAIDWGRFEFAFIGRTQEQFSRIRHVGPLPSGALAGALRAADVYVTASRNEPCSNALLEALACGLPALYLDDGSHGELVGQGGLPFRDVEEFLRNLDRIAADYEAFRSCVWVDSMVEIARRYIDLFQAILDDEAR
jgi:glycosyltransferase involved in cell wall biosynthesis